MSQNQKPSAAEEAAQDQPAAEYNPDQASVLIVTFKGRDSAQFGVQVHNVTPAQLLLVGTWLKMRAHHIIQQQWEQSHKQETISRIVRPGMPFRP